MSRLCLTCVHVKDRNFYFNSYNHNSIVIYNGCKMCMYDHTRFYVVVALYSDDMHGQERCYLCGKSIHSISKALK